MSSNGYLNSALLRLDDHDALKFLTYSLHGPDSGVTDESRITEEERVKLSKEFDDYQEKLEKQKEE